MPLNKQTFAVSLSAGVDTKTDPKQVVMGKLLVLENAVFTSKDRLRLRDGFEALGRDITNSPTHERVRRGAGLATYQDELLLWDGEELFSYDQSNDEWAPKGSFSSVGVTLDPIVRNTYQQTSQDGAAHETGLRIYAWEDSQGGVRYSVVDQTGLNVVHDGLVHASGSSPKTLALGGGLVVLYVNRVDGRLYSFPVRVADPTSVPASTALTPTSGSNDAALNTLVASYDAEVVQTPAGPYAYVAYNNQAAGGGFTLARLPPGGPTAFDASTNSAFGGGARAVAVVDDLVDLAPSFVTAGSGSVQFQGYDFSLSTRTSSGTLESVSGVFNVGATCLGSGSDSHMRAFYTVTASLSQNFSVRTNTWTSAGVTGTASGVLRSVGLAAKPFAVSGSAYAPLAYQSPTGTNLQTSYFVADQSGSIVAKLLYGLGGGIPSKPTLPETVEESPGTFGLSLLAREAIQTEGGTVFSQTGVERATVSFPLSDDSFLHAELGGNLHIGGGFVMMYDGVSPVEHGFHLFPEGITLAVGTGGALSGGLYQYCQTYEWADARGQVHRSAPSPAVQVSCSAGASVTATLPTLRLTAKADPRAPVSLVTYRTIVNAPAAANGGLPNFYRVTPLVGPTANDPTVDTLTFADTAADATILGNVPLYTNGGVLENVAAPPVLSIVEHKNRLFAIDATAPNTLWYTKEAVPGTRAITGAPAEFSDVLTINVDPRGGDATALGEIDDNLIVFKRNSVFLVAGDGPTATGIGGFNPPQLVTTDVGCTNQRSVVITPNGLMFQSQKGIYLLDRAFQAHYVGAEVEAFNRDQVTSAVLVPTTNQVRFTLASGVALVFDYFFQQWSVFTAVDAADSSLFQGKHAFLRPDGQARIESPGTYSDAGSVIRMKLVTGWFTFAGIQGFQRVYKVLVLGQYNSPHKLRASLSYDFNPSRTQIDLIDTSVLGAGPFGSDSPYGGSSGGSAFGDGPYGDQAFGGSATGQPYGGRYPLYQFRIFVQQQKCQAIQLTLEGIPSVAGEAFSLSSLGIEAGVKKGLQKKAPGVSFG